MTMDAVAIAAALARGDIEVLYQPVVVLPSRQVVGFEALARLRDLDGLLVAPSGFLPTAEESGLIPALGREFLHRAVAQAALWRAGSGALTTATVSLNIARAQLEQRDIVDVVTAVLAEHGVPGSALILEITESAAAGSGNIEVIKALSALGIRVAIDDFGTGGATLDSLRHFPAHMLKLDRSFVSGATREGVDRAIVRAVVTLTASLGLSVVADGIATEEQAAVVLRLGCATMQGPLFGAPVADPREAAAAASVTGGLPLPERQEGPQRWSVALDEAILAAARLLGATDSAHRGAVHAVATALARSAALDEQTVRAVGRLAMVHDLRRLLVDGALPVGLSGDERLRSLSMPAGAVREDLLPAEVVLVRAAVVAVDRASTVDPDLGPDALGEALITEAENQRQPVPGLCDLLSSVAAALPAAVPFGEVMDDLDRRRMGRRGMEDRVRSVFGITKVLSSSRDTRELMRVALEEVRRIVGAASASVEQWEREANLVRCLVSVGQLGPSEETFPDNEVYPLADYAQLRRTMLTGLPYIHRIDDPTAADDAVILLKSLGKFSSAAVPIYVDHRIWGQLWFATDHGDPPFEAGDIEILMAVATLMGGVVAQADDLQRVDRMAFEDALTHVGNRRVVDDALDRLSARGEQTVMALLDIDRLKEINDLEGHASGDAAIQRVADSLTDGFAAMPDVTIGRLGGDEFCILLPRCSGDQGRRFVHDILEQLTAHGGPSVSMGVAVAKTGNWMPRDLFAAADEDLYRAKRSAHQGGGQAGRRRRSRQALAAERP